MLSFQTMSDYLNNLILIFFVSEPLRMEAPYDFTNTISFIVLETVSYIYVAFLYIQ